MISFISIKGYVQSGTYDLYNDLSKKLIIRTILLTTTNPTI